MAMLISLVAMSIDAMLPALDDIAAELRTFGANSQQLVISSLLVGLSLGQLISGPLSDSFGRRPVIIYGLVIFLSGSLICIAADNFTMLLAGRFLQGLGAAAPRVVTVALIRDQFGGRAMAQMMSFIMSVFIVVPALAPAVGQTIIQFADWRAIFVAFLALAAVALAWFWIRQPETHPPEKRLSLRLSRIWAAFAECLSHPTSLCYITVAGFVFGSFVGYLTSAQQIFETIYGAGDLFPLYFGMLALALGGASVVNARIVIRFGMQAISVVALIVLALLSASGLAYAFVAGTTPEFWLFMSLMFPTFFCLGLVFGNVNALAMEPMGHIAGSAAAVISALNGLIAVAIGTIIGQSFDGTLVPLFAGFLVAVIGSLAAIALKEHSRRNGQSQQVRNFN